MPAGEVTAITSGRFMADLYKERGKTAAHGGVVSGVPAEGDLGPRAEREGLVALPCGRQLPVDGQRGRLAAGDYEGGSRGAGARRAAR